jgi:3-phenylpropionate/cinnamic acid dioxygenase small subunit
MVSAEQAIRNLLFRYCELQDAADFASVAELFRHATYAVDGGDTHHGYEELYALKTKHDKIYDDGTLRTKHVTTNSLVEVDDDAGTATARSYFIVLQATPALPLQIVIAGRYHDAFARVDGAWRFTHRKIFGDLVGDLTQHLRDNPQDKS